MRNLHQAKIWTVGYTHEQVLETGTGIKGFPANQLGPVFCGVNCVSLIFISYVSNMSGIGTLLPPAGVPVVEHFLSVVVCLHTSVHTRDYLFILVICSTFKRLFVCVHVHVCVYVCVCVCVCVCIYACMHACAVHSWVRVSRWALTCISSSSTYTYTLEMGST